MSPSDRQAERRTLLIDAAFDLLGTEGWSATTVRAVVERADLNPRYFYESFGDMDSLIVAVYDRVIQELGEIVFAALETAPGDPATQARAVVRSIVEFVDEDRRRGRVLYAEGLGNQALNMRRMEAGLAVVAFIEAYAAEQGGVAAPGREYIGRVGATVLVGGFGTLLVDWLGGRLPVSRETLIEDATELFLALGDAAAGIAARNGTPARRRRRA